MYFERYEFLIVIGGALLVFLIAGILFYFKAYRTVSKTPEGTAQITKINRALFDKVLKDLEQKKQAPKDLPIIDPFR